MTRSLFLRVAGVFHLLLGILFFLFTKEATALMIATPGAHMHLLVKGLSGIVAAFGGMSLMAQNATPGRALNAILFGTLFYLLFTVVCDAVWTIMGLLRPIAWVSIAIRVALAAGYGHFAWKGLQRRRERNGQAPREEAA
ncbi:MAG: hypothetical protein IPL52_04470 [Flavobacteriales bacterium]|nr:hypothetical protein [Flavobacteriales bacterium]